jgi:hypothetical protein
MHISSPKLQHPETYKQVFNFSFLLSGLVLSIEHQLQREPPGLFSRLGKINHWHADGGHFNATYTKQHARVKKPMLISA